MVWNRLLPGDLAHLVEQQGEDDRPREADGDLQEADADRVPQHLVELLGVEQALEVGEPDPRAAEQAAGDGVLLEGDDDAGHRDVAEQHEDHQCRQQQQQILAVPVHFTQKRAARTGATFGALRRDHHLLAHPNSPPPGDRTHRMRLPMAKSSRAALCSPLIDRRKARWFTPAARLLRPRLSIGVAVSGRRSGTSDQTRQLRAWAGARAPQGQGDHAGQRDGAPHAVAQGARPPASRMVPAGLQKKAPDSRGYMGDPPHQLQRELLPLRCIQKYVEPKVSSGNIADDNATAATTGIDTSMRICSSTV